MRWSTFHASKHTMIECSIQSKRIIAYEWRDMIEVVKKTVARKQSITWHCIFCTISLLPSVALDTEVYYRRFMRPFARSSFGMSFCPSVCLSVPNDVTALNLLAWNLLGRCTVPWSRSLFKIAMLGQFLGVPRDFEICHDALGRGLWDYITFLTL